MPIAVCNNVEELTAWCEETIIFGRYRGITTDEGEVIVEPTKTSRPLKYAYLQTTKPGEVGKKLSEKFGMRVIHVRAYRWNNERGPFVKVAVEE